jgi:hypothetical protein
MLWKKEKKKRRTTAKTTAYIFSIGSLETTDTERNLVSVLKK